MGFHEPFLLRFKQSCSSPDRNQPDKMFRYSEILAQVVTEVDGRLVPAIEAQVKEPPQTKKGDIEKGDDQKDRRMWG